MRLSLLRFRDGWYDDCLTELDAKKQGFSIESIEDKGDPNVDDILIVLHDFKYIYDEQEYLLVLKG